MQTTKAWTARVALVAVAAVCLTGAAAQAAAQSATGLRVGARWSQLDGGGDVDGTVTGLVVGGYFGFGLSDRLALQLEAVYGGRGADAVTFGTEVADGTAVTARLDMRYIDVPILLRAGFPGERILPSLFAGPYFGFLVSCDLTPEGGDSRVCDDEEAATARFDPRATDVGLVVGAGLDFLMGESTVFVDARYTAGLLSVEAGDDPMDARHGGLAVSGGFAIPLGR